MQKPNLFCVLLREGDGTENKIKRNEIKITNGYILLL